MLQKHTATTDNLTNILTAATGNGISDDEIMAKTHLAYDELLKYLSVLFQSELIEYDETTNLLETSEKGRRVLETCKEIQKFIYTELKDEVDPLWFSKVNHDLLPELK